MMRCWRLLLLLGKRLSLFLEPAQAPCRNGMGLPGADLESNPSRLVIGERSYHWDAVLQHKIDSSS